MSVEEGESLPLSPNSPALGEYQDFVGGHVGVGGVLCIFLFHLCNLLSSVNVGLKPNTPLVDSNSRP